MEAIINISSSISLTKAPNYRLGERNIGYALFTEETVFSRVKFTTSLHEGSFFFHFKQKHKLNNRDTMYAKLGSKRNSNCLKLIFVKF